MHLKKSRMDDKANISLFFFRSLVHFKKHILPYLFHLKYTAHVQCRLKNTHILHIDYQQSSRKVLFFFQKNDIISKKKRIFAN